MPGARSLTSTGNINISVTLAQLKSILNRYLLHNTYNFTYYITNLKDLYTNIIYFITAINLLRANKVML